MLRGLLYMILPRVRSALPHRQTFVYIPNTMYYEMKQGVLFIFFVAAYPSLNEDVTISLVILDHLLALASYKNNHKHLIFVNGLQHGSQTRRATTF